MRQAGVNIAGRLIVGKVVRLRGLVSMAAVFVLLIMIGSVIPMAVQAAPPISNLPIPISQYGIVMVSDTESFSTPSGIATITLNSNGNGAFFVVKLLIFLNPSGQTDLILDTISVNGYSYTFSQYTGAPKVIVVPSGTTIGEVVNALSTALPSYATLLLVKDPLQNPAFLLSGGTDNALTVKLRPATGGFGGFGYITAVAMVTAPSNNTISISMS